MPEEAPHRRSVIHLHCGENKSRIVECSSSVVSMVPFGKRANESSCPLVNAAFRIMTSASSDLPRAQSHRGLSGTTNIPSIEEMTHGMAHSTTKSCHDPVAFPIALFPKLM